MSPNLSGIYVPLDVLLDTRIGTVAKLGGNDLVLQVLSGNYHSRQDDKFPGVNVEAFKSMYANRDVATLSLSTLTGALPLIERIVASLMKQALVRPFHEGVRIVVNTYPYRLDEEDQKQVMAMLAVKMNVFSQVEIPFKLETVFLSDQELTPQYCKANFSAMLMYDYENWLKLQQEKLLRQPMPEVTLYAPALYFAQTPTDEQVRELKTQYAWSPFEAIEKAVRGGVFLQLLPVEIFSIIRPDALTA